MNSKRFSIFLIVSTLVLLFLELSPAPGDTLLNYQFTGEFVADDDPMEIFGRNQVGDANCDGIVNLLDVAPFVDLLTLGQYLDKADINQNGMVSLLDVQPFVNLLSGG